MRLADGHVVLLGGHLELAADGGQAGGGPPHPHRVDADRGEAVLERLVAERDAREVDGLAADVAQLRQWLDQAGDLTSLLELAVAWNEEARAKAAADSAAAASPETVGVD